MSQIKKLIVRVYGICLNPQGQLLIVDEVHHGKGITKFPGGGLELGEGPIDCVKREFMEETAREVRVLDHFYTTDFFVNSYFDFETQILSIYYRVELIDTTPEGLHIVSQDPELSFRWIELDRLNHNDFTFIIDRTVAQQILDSLK